MSQSQPSSTLARLIRAQQNPQGRQNLDGLLAQAAELLAVDKLALYQPQNGADDLRLKSLSPNEVGLSLPYPHALFDHFDLDEGQLDYTFCHINEDHQGLRVWLTAWDIEGLHCLPIYFGGSRIGVLMCGEQGSPNPWQGKQLETAQWLASLLVPWLQHQPSNAANVLTNDVMSQASESIMLLDAGGVILDINAAFTASTGYSHEDCFGKSASLLRSGRHSDEFYQHISDAVLESGSWQGEIWNKRKNGELYPQWLAITKLHDDEGMPFRLLCIFSDMSAVTGVQASHKTWGGFDSVTGLPNSKLLESHLGRSVALCERRARTLGLLMICVRPFGHSAGYEDASMAHIAGVILRCIRQNDYLARINDQEFALVIDEYEHSDQLARVACKVIQTLHENMPLAHPDMLFAAIGIARLGEDAMTAPALLAAAQSAVNHANRAESSQFYFYNQSLNQRWQRLWPLAQSLKDALADDQLVMHYQPVLNVESQEVVELEAMVRWQHPVLGLLGAAEFMSVARAAGLSVELFTWALKAASSCFNRIQAGGYGPLPISLNLNGHELIENDSFSQILQFLVDVKVAPGQIKLEIPEGYLLPHWNELKHILEQIRSSGVSVVMDAYGAEHASLYALAALDIDGMKLDRSLVAGVTEHHQGTGGMAALLAAANCLQFETVAVGVESEPQSQWLKASGCIFQQGDLFAGPMDEVTVLSWLKESRSAAAELES
ncbi:MAG: EAL domain-containing protein [Pontibacterium sp.]